MSKRHFAVILILVLLSVAGLVLSAVALLRPEASPVAALAGAVACLGLGQLIALTTRTLRERHEQDQMRDLMHMSTGLARDVSTLSSRFDRLAERPAPVAAGSGRGPSRTLNLGAEQKVATDSPATAPVRRSWREALRPAPLDEPTPEVEAEAAPVMPEPQRAPREPQLGGLPPPRPAATGGLMLEPVVQLARNETFAYRAQISGRGGLLGAASGAGEIFEKVAPVLRLMQRKGRDIAIFCPASAAELAAPAYLERLTRFLERNSDIAGQIVIDMTQDTLAAIDGDGAAGLAGIAERGVALVLSRCQPDGPDLVALKALGFRYLEYDMSELIARQGWRLFDEGGAMSEASQAALDNGLMVIAGNVNGRREAELAARFASLARGSHFARPRLVRADLTAADDRAAA